MQKSENPHLAALRGGRQKARNQLLFRRDRGRRHTKPEIVVTVIRFGVAARRAADAPTTAAEGTAAHHAVAECLFALAAIFSIVRIFLEKSVRPFRDVANYIQHLVRAGAIRVSVYRRGAASSAFRGITPAFIELIAPRPRAAFSHWASLGRCRVRPYLCNSVLYCSLNHLQYSIASSQEICTTGGLSLSFKPLFGPNGCSQLTLVITYFDSLGDQSTSLSAVVT